MKKIKNDKFENNILIVPKKDLIEYINKSSQKELSLNVIRMSNAIIKTTKKISLVSASFFLSLGMSVLGLSTFAFVGYPIAKIIGMGGAILGTTGMVTSKKMLNKFEKNAMIYDAISDMMTKEIVSRANNFYLQVNQADIFSDIFEKPTKTKSDNQDFTDIAEALKEKGL